MANLTIKPHNTASHGVRTVENLRVHCGITDPDELLAEARRFEEAIVSESRKNGRQGIVALPGVREIMHEVRVLPHSGLTAF